MSRLGLGSARGARKEHGEVGSQGGWRIEETGGRLLWTLRCDIELRLVYLAVGLGSRKAGEN